MMKKLTLVGKGEGWERAFIDSKHDREVWCVSTIFQALQTIEVQPTRVFQLHERRVFESWIEQEQNRVVLMRDDPAFPNVKILPAAELVRIFGARFSSTFAWMIGWALLEGFEDITIRGIHLAHETEYFAQRDAFFWFIGLAQGKGIKINIDEDSGVFIANQAYGVRNGQI
jgi:hypothetical protein